MTWVSAGVAWLAPATLYKKMYCVELAVSSGPVRVIKRVLAGADDRQRRAVRAELRRHRLAGDEVRVGGQPRVQELLNRSRA